MKDGKKFEKLTEIVFKALSRNDKYSKVERDVLLVDPDGEERQIDVIVESIVFGMKTTALIECRDYKRALNITHVDGYHSKVQDLPGDIAILVSRNGFSKNAIAKAKRVNIKLCTLDQPGDIADIGYDLRLMVAEIVPDRISFQFKNNSGEKFKSTLRDMRFNGLPLVLFIKAGLESNAFQIRSDLGPIVWPKERGQLVISNKSGIEIADAIITVEYTVSYYIGFLSLLKDSAVLKNITEGKTNIVYMLDELRNYLELFQQFSAEDPVVLTQGEVLRVHMLVPELTLTKYGGMVKHPDGKVERSGDTEAMEGYDITGPSWVNPDTEH